MKGKKKERVLSILRDFPEWDTREVAKKAGCSRVYVYKLRNRKPFVKKGVVGIRIPIGLKRLFEDYCKVKRITMSQFLRGYLEEKFYSQELLRDCLEKVFEERPELRKRFYRGWLENLKTKNSKIKEMN